MLGAEHVAEAPVAARFIKHYAADRKIIRPATEN
jgi:hypothetical protein